MAITNHERVGKAMECLCDWDMRGRDAVSSAMANFEASGFLAP